MFISLLFLIKIILFDLLRGELTNERNRKAPRRSRGRQIFLLTVSFGISKLRLNFLFFFLFFEVKPFVSFKTQFSFVRCIHRTTVTRKTTTKSQQIFYSQCWQGKADQNRLRMAGQALRRLMAEYKRKWSQIHALTAMALNGMWFSSAVFTFSWRINYISCFLFFRALDQPARRNHRWADFRGELLRVGGTDLGARRHRFRGRTLPSKTGFPDRLPVESTQDVVSLRHFPS